MNGWTLDEMAAAQAATASGSFVKPPADLAAHEAQLLREGEALLAQIQAREDESTRRRWSNVR
jgi:hypothetical protein